MKFLSFEFQNQSRYGVLDGDQIIDLTSAPAPTLRALLESGRLPMLAQAKARGGRRVPLSAIRFLPPITAPDKIICVGLNYRTHAAEVNLPIPEKPSLFVRFPGSQVGHGAAVVCPAASSQFDYEAELAVIIGRSGRHIEAADALGHVAGYSCFAENSVRDWQKHAAQITPGKNFQSSGAFGPWLTTPDEIEDLGAAEVIGRLNGEEVQRDRVSGLIFGIPALISYISAFAQLLPGDVISTGTPAGVGFARKPPRFMRPGDTLEVEVTGVGLLRNTVVAESAR